MDKRLVALIGLSILVALAGCNGATGPQSPTTSGDPPSQNETNQSEAVFEGVQLPNGTTATTINETQVLAAHHSLLASRDYRIGINLTHVKAGRIANTTTTIASNKSRQQLYLQSDLPGRSLGKYYTENKSLSRRVVGNDTTVTVDSIDSFNTIHERQARPGDLLTTLLVAAEFSAVNTTTVDGHDAVVYNVTNVSGSNSTRLPPTINQFNGSLIIDERGIIWKASLLTVGIRDGMVEAMLQEYRTLEHGNVRVTQPDWVQNQTQE